MKKFFLLLVVSCSLFIGRSYALEETINIDRLLESGEINQAKELIEKKFSPGSAHYNFLLAKIHFYQGDYLSAKEKLGQVLQLEAQEKTLKGLYEFYRKVYEKNKDFQEYESEHFRLRLKTEDGILKDSALEGLEKIYQKIGKEFNHFPKEKILVEIYESKENFLLASTLSEKEVDTSGAIGICKFNRLMIVSPRLLAFGYRWLDSLSHEYVHYLVNRITLYNCPLWLHEGVAKYFDRKWLDKEPSYFTAPCEHLLADAYLNKKLISFSRMSPSLVRLDSQEEVSLAFAQVANTVDYLNRNYGREKLINLLQELKNSENYDSAFLKIYGLNQEKIEKNWQKNLSQSKLETYPGVSIDKVKWQSADEIEEFVGADLRGHIRLGDKFRLRGRYESALFQYGEALKKEPNNPVILNKIAKTYLSLNKPEEAEKNFLKAIATNPNYGTSYFNLGNLYLNQKKYKSAEENYQEYLQINPFNPYLHKNLGLAYYGLKEIEKAKNEWLITKKLLPDDLEIQSMLNLLSPLR